MSHSNHTCRNHNRGMRHLNGRHKAFLEAEVDNLKASMGITDQPEPVEEKPQDDGFGLAEVITAFGLFSLVGILNHLF